MGSAAMGHTALDQARAQAMLQRCAGKAGILLLPDYGTLLGAARQGGMIPWDTDGDVSVFVSGDDFPARWQHFESLLRLERSPRAKLYPKRSGKHPYDLAILYGRATVDIFPWYRGDLGLWYRPRYNVIDELHRKGLFVHDDWLEEFTTLPFHNVKLKVSARYQDWLTHRYGDWRTPVDQKGSESTQRVFAMHQGAP